MQAKFKFKFVLTTVNYCAFCLFRFGKTVFNFKFKLILRKKKIYVNNFLTNFQLRLFISSAKISSLLGNYVTIRRTRHTGRVRLLRTRSGIQWITAFSLDSGYPPSADSGMTASPTSPSGEPAAQNHPTYSMDSGMTTWDAKRRGGVYPRPKKSFQKMVSRAGLRTGQIKTGRVYYPRPFQSLVPSV